MTTADRYDIGDDIGEPPPVLPDEPQPSGAARVRKLAAEVALAGLVGLVVSALAWQIIRAIGWTP